MLGDGGQNDSVTGPYFYGYLRPDTGCSRSESPRSHSIRRVPFLPNVESVRKTCKEWTDNATLVWLNMPLMIVFFAGWAGIPLWLVLTRWNRTDRTAARQPRAQQRLQPRPRPQPSTGRPSRQREAQLTH
jgi:hypothetical protein